MKDREKEREHVPTCNKKQATGNVHCAAVLEFDSETKEARRQIESEHVGAVTRELKGGATGAAADDETRASHVRIMHTE